MGDSKSCVIIASYTMGNPDPRELEKRFLEAYESYSDALYRHCYFRVYSREQAQDLVQETLTKTWQYLCEGNEVKNLRAFLYRVATNLIVDEARRRKRQKGQSLDYLEEKGVAFPAGEDELELAHNRLEAAEAQKVMRKLDDAYREVILMRYIDNLTPQEIAEILGEEPNTISVRLHRGVKKLKELLNHEYDE